MTTVGHVANSFTTSTTLTKRPGLCKELERRRLATLKREGHCLHVRVATAIRETVEDFSHHLKGAPFNCGITATCLVLQRGMLTTFCTIATTLAKL